MPKPASCTVLLLDKPGAHNVMGSWINTCTSDETQIQPRKCMFPIQFFVLYYPCIHTQLSSIKSRVVSSCGSWWYTRQLVIIRGWASLIPRHEPGNEARGELEQDLLKLMRMGQLRGSHVSKWWSHAMLTRKCMPNMIVFKWLWIQSSSPLSISHGCHKQEVPVEHLCKNAQCRLCFVNVHTSMDLP